MLGNIEPMQVDIPEENENEAGGSEENEVDNCFFVRELLRSDCFSRSRITLLRTPAWILRPPAMLTLGWPSSLTWQLL